jgi:hypothetical protein
MLPALLLSLALLPSALPASSLRLADLTGDGLPEKLVVASDGALSVKLNLGRGRFAPVEQTLPAATITDLLADDLNGDGHTDLYLVSPDANLALLGDGTGRLFDATDVLGLADAGTGISAERMDLDGVAPQELVLHNAGGDVLFWARGSRFVRDADSTPDAVIGDGALQHGATAGGGTTGSPVLDALLPHLSVVWLDDAAGGQRKTVRLTGVNLQIVNGLGSTNGNRSDPFAVAPVLTRTNGVGNLIIGYDEPRQFGPHERTGSHNLVLGKEHSYPSFGGLVAGDANRVTAPFSSAAGGYDQTASGLRSAVLGGQENVADGEGAAVLGGGYNCASGMLATASGGAYNLVPGEYASLLGGESLIVSGITAVGVGGAQLTVSGTGAVGVGGVQGMATAYGTVVVGGEGGVADGSQSVVVGGAGNRAGPDGGAGGEWAVVVGGQNNLASGNLSTVAGGGGPEVVDGNVASGNHSAVSGGRTNVAGGDHATVGGGAARAANGTDDWAAGGLFQDG